MTHPILVTGAAGRVGGVGGLVVEALRRRGLPVRALVRREDERAEALRTTPGSSSRPGCCTTATAAGKSVGKLRRTALTASSPAGKNQLSWATYSSYFGTLPHATFAAPGGPHNPSRSATADRNEAARARRTTQHAAIRRRLTMITPSSTSGGCVIVQPSRLHIVSTTRKRALPLIMRS